MKFVLATVLIFVLSQQTLAVSKSAPKSAATDYNVYTSDGGSNSGGGGILLAEFYTIARKTAEEFRLMHSGYVDGRDIDLTLFSQVVKRLIVEVSSKPLLLDGEEKDAINFPKESKIIFYSKVWETKNYREKEELVVHELLGLLKIEDFQFSFSKALVAYKIRQPMNPLHCTTKADGKLIQRGFVEMFHSPGAPEGAGYGVIYENDHGIRIIAEDYPLNIFVQEISGGGLVVEVTRHSILELTRQVVANGLAGTGHAWWASFDMEVDDVKYEVFCIEQRNRLN